MDKYCQNCNQANPADAVFCRNCSATLPQNQSGGQQQGNQQWNQPNAGNQPNFQPPNFGNQQQHNAPNFGNQQQFNAPPANNVGGGASTRATVALVLAIASLFCCAAASIPAAIVGWIEVSAIKRGESPQAGMTMAQIGLWGGVVMTILSVIGGIFWMIMVISSGEVNYYTY